MKRGNAILLPYHTYLYVLGCGSTYLRFSCCVLHLSFERVNGSQSSVGSLGRHDIGSSGVGTRGTTSKYYTAVYLTAG